MTKQNYDEIISKLNEKSGHLFLNRRFSSDKPMPNVSALTEILERIKKVLFPGFWGYSEVNSKSVEYFIGANLDIIQRLLSEQIKRGICFECLESKNNCNICKIESDDLSNKFIAQLPYIKDMLITDIIAAYNGDPAARSYEEVIYCYPGIIALTHHRIAYELIKLEIPLIPRMINELAHSQTGIDIHPGAEIGKSCFIDHGTGVVIGETCIIGDNVRIYQGVTLGAKRFEEDEDGKLKKGAKRHPIIGNGVVIYANATILGRIKIEDGTVINGNAWITKYTEA